MIRNYLDFLLALPWKKEEKAAVDLEEARQILEADHYGLEKVKERILQYLAVLQLKKGSRGSILLLVDTRSRVRPAWAGASPERWGGSISGSAWEVSGTRRRSAATGGLMWAPCPAGSCRASKTPA